MDGQEAGLLCSGCGATNASEARFCGICGRQLLEESASAVNSIGPENPDVSFWQAEPLLADIPLSEGAGSTEADPLGETQAAAQASAEGVKQKRCAWCSGLNLWVAAVCEVCGARFPVPEQDEAFRLAAEERIRQDEASLEFWRQRRQRRGWRRFLLG